jgi:hypothetical protein
MITFSNSLKKYRIKMKVNWPVAQPPQNTFNVLVSETVSEGIQHICHHCAHH